MPHKRPWLDIYAELGIKVPEFQDMPLGSYIETHAAAAPDAPAIHYFNRTFSYEAYNIEANKLANALKGMGIGRGDVVGIHMPNIPQYMIALGAISKIGATGSGVSPLLAPPELKHQISDANIKVLMSLSDLSPAISGMGNAPKCLKTIIVCGARDYLDAPEVQRPAITGPDILRYLTVIEAQSDSFSQVDVHWNDTFMVQYTGGTTGKPKGAELSHRNLMHNPVMVSAGDPPTDLYKEVYATAFPLFHVAGLCFSLMANIAGASFTLFPNPRDVDAICSAMKANPPTRLGAVPALYDMMLANPMFHDIDFSKLKSARMGAAPMTASTYNALKDVVGENKISDVLGMTETGPCYINHPQTRYKAGSVGIPCAGADVRIMDIETGTKVMPFGEPGELVSAGPQVMKGYLNLPEESSKALRELDDKIWMYSGDVAYMDEEGYVFLCDRAKDMLIVGGFKVFSVEVEDKLQSMPQIASTAVIGTPDEKRPGNDIVNLYVQLDPVYKNTNETEIKEQIIAFCRENMAAYKVPKAIHIIDEIPLTPVGKIDKKALRT